MNNSIIFHEIISQSPVELQPFYAQVFGWQFTMVSDTPELVAIKNSVIQPFGLPNGPAPAGLLTQQSDEPGYRKDTLFYVQVESVDATLEAVQQHGGKVLLPKATDPIGDYRYTLAVVADPENNHLGIMEPVQIVGSHGHTQPAPVTASQFAFNEIISENPSTLVQQFYQPIFRWRAVDAGTPEAPFFEISTTLTHTMPQLGIAKIADSPGFGKFNGFYIQVEDVANTLAIIQQHGGQTVMPPVSTTLGNKAVEIAMFCDPQHNRIGLISTSG